MSLLNECSFRAAASGLADFAVASATTGFFSPAQCTAPAVADGASYHYRAESDDQSQHESGTGTYTVATATLARTTVLQSSNANAKVNFSAAPTVRLVALAQDFAPAPSGLTIGSTAISGGTTGDVLYDNAGVLGNIAIRQNPAADINYYVSPVGSDSNDGLTPATAFLTLAHADAVIRSLDLSIYTATVNIADGTYAGWSVGPYLTSGLPTGPAVSWNGNHADPTKVVIQENPNFPGTILSGGSPSCQVQVADVTFDGSTLSVSNSLIEWGLEAGLDGILNINGNGGVCIFSRGGGATSFDLCACLGSGLIQVYDNITINTGSYDFGFIASGAGAIISVAAAFTLVGTPNFADFVKATTLGQIDAHINGAPSFSGAATGGRYSAVGNGVIDTNGQAATFFPGNVGGTTATGGQYL